MNIEQIDTRHATFNDARFSNGNSLPLTGVPHAMNYFSPQTNSERGAWWFHPEDNSFEGIRMTHQASPWVGDFGAMSVLATTGKLENQSIWATKTSYLLNQAIFSPYYLKLRTLRYLVTSEVTPSIYGAKLRFTYKQENAGLLLHLGEKHELHLIDKYEVSGWVSNFASSEDEHFKMYFSLSFNQPIQELNERHLLFGDIENLEAVLATSFISIEQAKTQLTREKQQSFEETKQVAKSMWQNLFDRVEIEHQNEDEVKTFAHNYYRAFLFPMRFYELDEKNAPIHYQTLTKEVKQGVYYTNTGFWDTSKSLFPLYTLIYQEGLNEMLEGFLNVYLETGFLPKWLAPDERGMMPGTLIDSMIADCLTKNIRLDLAEQLLEAMLKSATVKAENSRYGRKDIENYNSFGYVPFDEGESVNETQDYAYSDWCIATVAKLLGKDELAKEYFHKAITYRTLIDKKTGLMFGKDKEGNFREHKHLEDWIVDYTEGSVWQNSFGAVHDLEGYIEVIGGKPVFKKLLIRLSNQLPTFDKGNYGFEIHEMSEMATLNFGQVALSNQPSFHVPYLFSMIGAPENTQVLVRQLMKNAFSYTSKAYPGDEDNGSMAAWFLFSALGFYPVSPGKKEYQLGVPLFDSVKVKLANGNILHIMTDPNELQHQFVQRLTVNGKEHMRETITHEELMNGGCMEWTMGIVPPE